MANENKIYEIISKFLPNVYWLANCTKEWCDDTRVNVLWLWAIENYDKYDPERGNLEQWLKGSARRIIDVYRKEKGSRNHYLQQYPLIKDEKGEYVDYAQRIPDRVEESSFDKEDKELLEESLGILSDDNRVILEAIGKRASIRGHWDGTEDALAESLGISKVSMQSRRMQSKARVKEHMISLKAKRNME